MCTSTFYTRTDGHTDRRVVDALLGILDVLKTSTFARSEFIEPMQNFWEHYKAVAESFDKALLRKYNDQIDLFVILVILTFVRLFHVQS